MHEGGGRFADSGGGPGHLLEPSAHAGGDSTTTRVIDFAAEPAERIFRMIQQAPDIAAAVPQVGGGAPPPPEPQDGDGRPDRDWTLIAVLAFGAAFSAVSAGRFAVQLLRELAA